MFGRINLILVSVAAALFLAIAPAHAENRVALVIGNSSYRAVSALPNPAKDAKAVSEFLTAAGFEVVSTTDLTQSDMRQAISEFASRIAAKGPDTVALVFYAGHGLQVDGENFLLPVDAQIERETDVPMQAVRLADVMNALASVPSSLRIVMLDACRNNPFSAINKTTGRGLAIVDAPAGSIVAYATAPGSEAEDGTGANSPFTAAFTSVARDPCVPVELAFKQVRVAVNKQTDGRQTPWDSSSLTSNFSFFAGCTKPKEKLAADDRHGKTAEFWRKQMQGRPVGAAYELVIGADVPEAYQEFISLYPTAPFAPRVRSLLERRQEMAAWYRAVSLNSIISFQAFLARYGSSDLAATALRLQDRARSKPQPTLLQTVGVGPAPGAQCSCSPAQRRTGLPPSPGTTVVPGSREAVVVPVPPVVKPPIVDIKPPGDGIRRRPDKPTTTGVGIKDDKIRRRPDKPTTTGVGIKDDKIRRTGGPNIKVIKTGGPNIKRAAMPTTFRTPAPAFRPSAPAFRAPAAPGGFGFGFRRR